MTDSLRVMVYRALVCLLVLAANLPPAQSQTTPDGTATGPGVFTVN
jgi:hypothetical protein